MLSMCILIGVILRDQQHTLRSNNFRAIFFHYVQQNHKSREKYGMVLCPWLTAGH